MLHIEQITQEDLPKALQLVKEVFDGFQKEEYKQEGILNFYKFIDQKNFERQLQNHLVQLFGCFREDELVGVLGIRLPNHICLLFVSSEHHRKGIASKLLTHWLTVTPYIQHVTVNATPFAVEAYKKLGFVPVDSLQHVDGITFLAMEMNHSLP